MMSNNRWQSHLNVFVVCFNAADDLNVHDTDSIIIDLELELKLYQTKVRCSLSTSIKYVLSSEAPLNFISPFLHHLILLVTTL
jgi:hypothetical protein